jgi:hypothetical protein
MRRSGGAVLAVMGLVMTVMLPVVALQHEVAAVGQRIEHQVEKKLFSRICTASLERAGRAEWARWCDPQKTVRERLRSWSKDRLTSARDRLRSRGRVSGDWEAQAEREANARAVEDTEPSGLARDTADLVRAEGGGSAADTAGESPGTAPAEAEVDLEVASGEALEGEALADTVAAGTEALDVAGAARFAVGRGNVIGVAVLAAFSAIRSAWEAHRRQEAGPLMWSPDDVRWALGACRLPDLLWALGTPKSLLAWTFWYGWGDQLRTGSRASVDGSYRAILDWRAFTPRSCVYAADPVAMQTRVAAAFTALERRSAAVDRSAVAAVGALTLDDLTGFLIGLVPRGGDLGGLEDVVLALEQPDGTARAQLLDSLRKGRWDAYDRLHEAAMSPLAAGAGGPGEKIQASLDAVVNECGCRGGVAGPLMAGAATPVDDVTSTAMLLAMADVLSNDDVATDPTDGSEVQTSVGREGNAGLFAVLPSQFERAMTEGGETRQRGQQVDTSVASQGVAAAQLLADALRQHDGSPAGAFAQFVHDNRLPPWDAAWRGMNPPEGWDDLLRTRQGRAGHLPTATLLATVTREYASYLTAPDLDDSSGSASTAPVALRGPLSPLFGWVPPGGYPDAFPAGQCTYWVAYNVRVTWNGNAREWLASARAQGYATSATPSVGSIVVWEGGPYDPHDGHVAVVTAVAGDLYTVSEMNFLGAGVVDMRSIHDPDPYALGFILVPH